MIKDNMNQIYRKWPEQRKDVIDEKSKDFIDESLSKLVKECHAQAMAIRWVKQRLALNKKDQPLYYLLGMANIGLHYKGIPSISKEDVFRKEDSEI